MLQSIVSARERIGGGMIGPESTAIMLRELPKEKLGMAMGFFMIPALASSSFGPTLGGWLIDNFSLRSVILFIFGLGIFGSDFLLPLYLQVGLGYTPTQAGIVFLPFGFVMIIAGIIGGRLPAATPARKHEGMNRQI